ncbi:MAG: histidine kinase [Clostridia bacterium]|nr:histidine kinase [Clostridia bacterium]
MPTVSAPHVNIALDMVGFFVVLIIFAACVGEKVKQKRGSKYFLILLIVVMLALIADIVGWIGEGHPRLSTVTLISNTVAACLGEIVIISFMEYLCENLYENSKAAVFVLRIFRVLCLFSILYLVGNAFGEYAYRVDDLGHYVPVEDLIMVVLYFLFPLLSFLALILMALFANHTPVVSRISFVSYTVLPVVGIIWDQVTHGISLTYVTLALSALAIYTGIFIRRQDEYDRQEKALMISQINPHFTYNTLTAIASMCDSSPRQAKSLTIDFARYLRHNLDTLTCSDTIPFEKELEHVECYLRIEKARFRERLNVVYSIQCTDFRIPPLTVQPLVENAVKHGITKKAAGGTVRISAFSDEKHYVVEIIDDGVGFHTETASGKGDGHVGLSNVESRVKRMCRGTLDMKSTPGVGTRVTLTIPRRKGGKA